MGRITCLNATILPLLGALTLTGLLLISAGCQQETEPDVMSDDSTFSAVPLPDPGIPGYAFPEPESTIVGWASRHDSVAINRHAWGIWTALTAETDQIFDEESLRVFETWFTPGDIKTSRLQRTPLQELKRAPRPLEVPHQLTPPTQAQNTVVGFVKYDPSAATFAGQNDLFSAATLDSLRAAGQAAIPNFPSTAVTLKPVFLPNFVDSLALIEGRYYMLPVWPGPPDSAQAWGFDTWPGCVWVDTQDLADGPGTGAVDTTCSASGTTSRTSATTYGLGRFVHFVEDGTTYLLVAMHVTSREITRWTWQTFWWTPTPDAPHAPSSRSIAAERPAQLRGAPRHYAHCTAYSMVDPPQPNTGGSNTGNSVYCYNPWLEAGFTPEVLPDSRPGTYHGMPVRNDYGVQTNCMSCHAQARWPTTPDSSGNNPFYTGDRYIDIDGAVFDGFLKLDFAWSIQGNAD